MRAWASFLVIAASARAEAQQTSSLSWVRMPGAESCVSTRGLAEAVEARLGRSVFVSASRGDVSVEGRVERLADLWSATVTVSAADGTELGTRTIESTEPECSALDAPLALVIALLIDPDATEPEPEPEPEIARPPAAPRVARPRAPPASTQLDADVRGALAAGLLPGTALGIWASVGVRPPRWPGFTAEAALFPARSTRGEIGRVELLLAWGGVAVCPLEGGTATLHLRLCGGVLVGALSVSAVGLGKSDGGDHLVVDAALRSSAALRLSGPLFARASLALLVPFVRDSFREGDDGALLFRRSAVGLALDGGLAIRFP